MNILRALFVMFAVMGCSSSASLSASDAVAVCVSARSNGKSIQVLETTIRNCTEALADAKVDGDLEATIYMKRGVARRFAGDLQGSLGDLTTAVEIDPNTALNRRMLGWTLRVMGKFDLARDQYSAALALDREYQGLLSRCDINIAESKWEMARRDCEESMALDRNPDSLYMTSLIYSRSHRDEKAVVLLEEAIVRPDTEARQFALLSCIYKRLQKVERANFIKSEGMRKFPAEYPAEERAMSCHVASVPQV